MHRYGFGVSLLKNELDFTLLKFCGYFTSVEWGALINVAVIIIVENNAFFLWSEVLITA